MITVKNEDFDIEKIADSGQCFRLNRCGDHWVNIAGSKVLRICEADDSAKPESSKNAHGSAGEPKTYLLDCTKKEFSSFWAPYFDLESDYSAYRASIPENDAFLSAAADFGRGIRILRQDPWEMLITFILSQRKNIPAIKAGVEALCRNYGDHLSDTSSEDLYAFPSIYSLAHATENKLKECGLGYRVPYIISAARAVDSGEIDLSAVAALPDEELLSELMKLYGVGIKVANCISLFAYHRINAFPIDVWIARVLDEKYGGCFDSSIYEGYKGVIQQYMFYYIRNNH